MDKDYTINELSTMSGLTTRTLRNYMNLGILNGSKQDGIWKFNEIQINDFFSHPSVKPSVQAKNKAIVYDFLADDSKNENSICAILDLQQNKAEQACALCITKINETESQNIRFSYEHFKDTGRVILSGPQEFVTDVLNQLKRL